MANRMGGLRTLLGLQGPSNFKNVADAGPGAVDMFSSEGEFVPSDAELKDVQRGMRRAPQPAFQADPNADATTNFSNELQAQAGGGAHSNVSRAELREGGMSALRRTLGIADRDQQRKTDAQSQLLEQEQAGAMDRQRLAADTQLESTRIAADSRAQQAQAEAGAQQSALDRLLSMAGGDRSVNVSGVGSIGAPKTAADQTRPLPQGLLKSIADAEAELAGQWWTSGADRQKALAPIEAALAYQGQDTADLRSAVATAQQNGLSATQLIQQAEAAGEPVTDLERKYLIAALGE